MLSKGRIKAASQAPAHADEDVKSVSAVKKKLDQMLKTIEDDLDAVDKTLGDKMKALEKEDAEKLKTSQRLHVRQPCALYSESTVE